MGNNIIAIGSDHAGFLLKSKIIEYLKKNNYLVEDFGTDSEKSVDYPDIAHRLAKAVNDGKFQRGILICGSGIGVSIVANKYEKVRAALCWNKDIAMFSRLHNDANIICFPARFIDEKLVLEMINVFFNTEFEGGRHKIRVEKIEQILK
jgi:ribose 5-phosphate isomerase B